MPRQKNMRQVMVAVMSRSCDTTAYDDDDGNDNEHVYDVNTLAQLKIGSAAATACPAAEAAHSQEPGLAEARRTWPRPLLHPHDQRRETR